MNNDLLNISLNQGKNFNKYQSKIINSVNINNPKSNRKGHNTKGHNNMGYLKEGFVSAEREQIVMPQEYGYVPVLQKQCENASTFNDANSNDLNDLKQLQFKYEYWLEQYNAVQKSIGDSSLETINRVSKNNPYLNKNVKFNNEFVAYVTSEGILKPYPSIEVFNNVAGKNGCPGLNKEDVFSVDIPFLSSYVAGTKIQMPNNISLIIGSPMTDGESCGNEGKNVYANTLVKNLNSTYVGCYNDKPAPSEVLIVPQMTADITGSYTAWGSTVYQDNYGFAGPWCAFDNNVDTWWHSKDDINAYDSNTGVYQGTNYLDCDGRSKQIYGEFLGIFLPSEVPLTKYSIQGRQGCCGDPNGRDPNTWYIVGLSQTNGWTVIDYQENVSFNWQMKTFEIKNPQSFNGYAIIITVVGAPTAPAGTRNSVQIATWNLYTTSDAGITNDQRAMIWNESAIGYTTYDQCQQYAVDNGYQYFGMQDNRGDGTAACLVSNDITRTVSYGTANDQITILPIWASNTAGQIGAYATLTSEGYLAVKNGSGVNIFETPRVGSCVENYGVTTGGDAWGNDIASFSGPEVNPQYCQDKCTDDYNCVGFTMDSANNTMCWIKSDVSTITPDGSRNTYKRVLTKDQRTACKFKLIVQNDGNLCIYQDGNGDALWASNTYGKQQLPNADWVSTKGKTGTDYLASGLILMPDEWIGSANGAVKLIMQQDGNLVLYTSTPKMGCVKNANGYTVGGSWINAVYKLDEVGNKSSLGKMGYIDSNANLREYPQTMLKYSDTYQIFNGYDSAGNDISNANVSSQDDCQTACSTNDQCSAYVFQSSTNTCWLKNSNAYPKGVKSLNASLTLGVRGSAINGANNCSSEVVNIDTVQYDNYSKGEMMTPDTQCNSALVSSEDRIKFENIKNQLAIVVQDIVGKMESLYSNDNTIYKKMNMNEQQFKKKLEMYKLTNAKIRKDLEIDSNSNIEEMNKCGGNSKSKMTREGMLTMSDVDGMLNDTDLRVLQQNYQYICLSILAVGFLIVTTNLMKK